MPSIMLGRVIVFAVGACAGVVSAFLTRRLMGGGRKPSGPWPPTSAWRSLNRRGRKSSEARDTLPPTENDEVQ